MLLPALIVLSVSAVSAFDFGFPLHASCNVDWTFSVSCAEAKQAIMDQMEALSGPDGCANGGEKCLYQHLPTEGEVVKGTHTTPVSRYVDDLEFTFTDVAEGSCAVHGFSTSQTWYAVLDMGTNYCNLKNLVTGSALDQSEGFSERTSNAICTQYSSADCEVY